MIRYQEYLTHIYPVLINRLSRTRLIIQMGENDEDANVEEGLDFQIAMYRWQSILNLKTALPMIPDLKDLS